MYKPYVWDRDLALWVLKGDFCCQKVKLYVVFINLVS